MSILGSTTFAGKQPGPVAEKALKGYRRLTELISESHLSLSVKKSGFVRSSKETRKELQARRSPADPQVFTCMRDLGVDCALGRCRRVKLQKARFRRGAHRNKKLGALKIPQPRINLRLFRGGVSSAMLWGSPCPSRREYLRTRLSRQLARHKFGHIDVVYDFQKRTGPETLRLTSRLNR